MRAAVMSCTEPGSAGETHSGNPSGASTAWMLPPWVWALPEYHRSMTWPFTLTAGSLHRSGDDLPVQDHMRETFVFGPLQCLVQVRGLFGEHRDHFVHIPVGGGPRDAVITGQPAGSDAAAEPAQAQHRLPKAGQRPAAARGATLPPLGGQQRRGEMHQFSGDVKRGTIGDHVEPSGEEDLVVRPLLPGLHAHYPPALFVRVSARMPVSGPEKARPPESTSL